jgi:hypothetical protein
VKEDVAMRTHFWPHTLKAGQCLVALVIAVAILPGLRGQEPPTVREIRVPFDRIPILFEKESDRVLLPRAQFAELQAKARQRTAAAPPVAALPVAATYHIAVATERAVITGSLTISVLADGVHEIPLSFSGVGLRRAEEEGRPAAVGRLADGRLVAFVEGKGDHTLAVEAVAPLQTSAARQVLDIALPVPPGTRITLSAPGDVELRSGAAVASRLWDEKAGETRFELVPPGERLSLVMSLNSRLKRQDRVVVARSVIIDELTPAYERLHATVSLDVLHRAVDEFRFQLPAGFEVTDVQSPLLSRWAVTAAGGGMQLAVYLREETSAALVLGISAQRARPELTNWQLPWLEPLDVVGHVAIVGVLLDRRLQTEELVARDGIAIDSSVILQALPATARLDDPGRPPLRAAIAYYAPSAGFALSGRFTAPPAGRRVTSNLLLTVARSGLSVRGGFAVLAENEKLFSVEVDAPADWDVTSVSDAAGTPLAFERYAVSGQPGRLLVRFPTGSPPGTQQTVVFEASYVPPGWLDPWLTRQVVFPVFSVRAASRDNGAIAANAGLDLRVLPDTLQGLTPLNENEKAKYGLAGVEASLAYRYDSPPYAATLTVARIEPRLTAETFSFFRVEQDALICHAEVVYDVAEAQAQSLELLLPASTPVALAITGLGDTAVKGFSSVEAGSDRRWLVELAQPAAGVRKLAVDFQMRLEAGAQADISLPIVRAAGVAYQSGFLAVEGNPELDVRLPQPPRKVDIGELVEAEYQPGARLLGAYGFVGEPPAVTLSVVRPHGCPLPPAIIQQARITTVLSAEGAAQSQAEFVLHTKALYLEIELPTATQLWSVTVDGNPARPQQEKERILLDLPASQSATNRVLLLVYETAIPTLGALGGVSLTAPRLLVHEGEDGTSGEVPATDLLWRVYLPTGVEVLEGSGTVVLERPARPSLAAVNLLRGLWQGSGGVRFRHGLVGGCLAGLGSARVAALRSHNTLAKTTDEMAAAPPYADHYAATKSAKPQAAPAAPPPATAAPLAAAKERQETSLERSAGEERLGEAEVLDLSQTATATPSPSPEPTAPAGWAVEGARSLNIALVAEGPSLLFRSLGAPPSLRLFSGSTRRLSALAWALALGVVVGGAALTRRCPRTKAAYVAAVLGAATVLPALPGMVGFTAVFNATFYAACLLLPYYLLTGFLACLRPARQGPSAGLPRAALPLLGLGVGVLSVLSGATSAADAPSVAAPSQAVIIQGIPLGEPVTVPKDVVIVPYAAGQAEATGELVLVPRDTFAALWQAAFPDPTRPAVSVPFALAGMAMKGTLGSGEVLQLDGWIDVDVFSADFVEVSLPLSGAVLSRATLDGQPAHLRVVQGVTDAIAVQSPAALPTAAAATLVSLPIQGRGRHRLELTAQVRLTRQGGWRVAAAVLPVAPAATLDLIVPDAGTEVRFSNVSDRQVYDDCAAGDTLRTTLPPDGALRVQWRPRVSEGQVDRSLTVVSKATFDILDDRLQTAWAMDLAFRHGDREVFTVDLPAGYQVERVEGSNVRGWELRQDGPLQRLDIALLKQARNSENFVVHAWRQGANGMAGETVIEAPVLGVVGAIRHTGQLRVRHSPALSLRSVEAGGLQRIDMPAEAAPVVRDSPLGTAPFQAYEFVQVPFALKLAVTAATPEVTATVQTILRIAERERHLESRFLLSVQQRPLHRIRIDVPADLELDRVSAPGVFEWGIAKAGAVQVVTVYLANGLRGDVPLVLTGRLGLPAVVTEVAVPRLWVLDVGRQEGCIAVQVDPLYDVVPRQLVGIESVHLRRVLDWLAEAQRPLTRLALSYTQAAQSGLIALQPLAAGVRCHTVTNVRVTDRAIEETTLLYFEVYKAAVQEFRFRLPKRLAEARITVPHLRQKTVTPVADRDAVSVVLELQDQVTGEVRVLIEHDRLLTEQEQEITLPEVESGRTDRQYLAVESAGRDEVLVEAGDGFDVLTAQQQEWGLISGLFQGGSTQAYMARSGIAAPRATFRTKPRLAVETAGARIGLASTLMLLDDSGSYRAAQTYHVDNRTEQFLELQMPAGAALWAVRVGDDLAKPIQPDPAAPWRVQVPLVKTAAGDLDYSVVLKYAGRLRLPGPLRPVDLPFVRTLNINVEQSQVELWLPTTRQWFGFDGTLRRVRQGGEFEAGYLAYQNKLAKRLLETLQFGSAFEKARAASNLRQVNVTLAESQQLLELGDSMLANQDLQSQVEQSQKLVQDADRQLQQAESEQSAISLDDNRKRMNLAFSEQTTGLARNRVIEAGTNWDAAVLRQTPTASAVDSFQRDWLVSNALAADTPSAPAQPVAGDGVELGRTDAEQGKDENRKREATVGGAAPSPSEEPQAVRMDSLEAKVARPPAEDFGTKASGRRGQQTRAAQYQQKLAAGKSKGAPAEANSSPWFAVAGEMGGRPEQLAVPGLTAANAAGMPGGMPQSGPANPLLFDAATGAGAAGNQLAQMGQMAPGAGMAGNADYANGAGAGLAGATGLASLDVRFPGFDPQRWAAYRFTTPRGSVRITARALAVHALERLERLGAAVAAVVLVLSLRRLWRPVRLTASAQRSLATYGILAGLVSLLLGICPMAGVAALLGGICWRLALALARRLAYRRADPL